MRIIDSPISLEELIKNCLTTFDRVAISQISAMGLSSM
jgi:hypothetical protein